MTMRSILGLLLASVTAFAPVAHRRRSMGLSAQLWNDIDTLCLENTARHCLDSHECSVDDTESLANRLVEQSALMKERALQMELLADRLDHYDDDLMGSISQQLAMEQQQLQAHKTMH